MTERTDIAANASRLSDEGAAAFLDIVKPLMESGAERYDADLVRSEKTYYWPDGFSARVPNAEIKAEISPVFSAQGVADAVRASQAGEIKYKEFCARAMKAGCVGYHVTFAGKRVIYYGRTGDAHTEWFPGARP
jgi:uncharacterized protein YbcV (DUF1398 family)